MRIHDPTLQMRARARAAARVLDGGGEGRTLLCRSLAGVTSVSNSKIQDRTFAALHVCGIARVTLVAGLPIEAVAADLDPLSGRKSGRRPPWSPPRDRHSIHHAFWLRADESAFE